MEQNRDATLLQCRIAGLDEQLALAIWQRDGDLGTSLPYRDTAAVRHRLKADGASIAIVSDIHYGLEPHFAAFGLQACIDQYVLSFEYACQKPDARLFQAALDRLGVQPAEALMVGDRPARDAGGVALGIATLILPPAPDGAERGLSAVLRLVGAS